MDKGAVEGIAESRGASKSKHVARTVIHESIGYVFSGNFHTDYNKTDGKSADRYGGNYMFDNNDSFIPNLMTSGHNTVYDDKRTFDFVLPDLNNINSKIPKSGRSFYDLYNSIETNCAKDNFSIKID